MKKTTTPRGISFAIDRELIIEASWPGCTIHSAKSAIPKPRTMRSGRYEFYLSTTSTGRNEVLSGYDFMARARDIGKVALFYHAMMLRSFEDSIEEFKPYKLLFFGTLWNAKTPVELADLYGTDRTGVMYSYFEPTTGSWLYSVQWLGNMLDTSYRSVHVNFTP